MSGEDDHCHPVINLEEMIGKTAGKRTPRRGFVLEGNRKVDKERWRKVHGGVGVPRGVYRFSTHEEADAWMMRHVVATAVKRAG